MNEKELFLQMCGDKNFDKNSKHWFKKSEGYDFTKLDWKDTTFTELYFSLYLNWGGSLENVTFDNCQLKSNLRNSSLKHVVFNGGKITSYSRSCNLNQVHFKNSELQGGMYENIIHDSEFSNCLLKKYVSFKKCDLKELLFDSSKLMGTMFEEQTHLKQVRFKACELAVVSFGSVSLEDCLFESNVIRNLSFDQSVLLRLQATDAAFQGTTYFSDTEMTNSDFSNSVFNSLSVSKSKLHRSCFSGVKFKAVIFQDCDLLETDFKNALLKDATFERVSLDKADFSGADLRGVTFKKVQHADKALYKDALYDLFTKLPPGIEPEYYGMKLVGKKGTPNQVAAPSSLLSREKFFDKYGLPHTLTLPNALLKACVFYLDTDSEKSGSKQWLPMINGVFWSIGYYRSDIDPNKENFHWGNLSKDLELAHEFGESLKGVYESSESDNAYYPFVAAPPLGKENEWNDFPQVLGVNEELQSAIEAMDITGDENLFIDESDYNQHELEEYFSKDDLRIYREASKLMNKSLKKITYYKLKDESVVTYPVFLVGKSLSGAFVGVFSARTES